MTDPTSAPDLPQYAVLDGGFATELVRHGFKEIDVSIPIMACHMVCQVHCKQFEFIKVNRSLSKLIEVYQSYSKTL